MKYSARLSVGSDMFTALKPEFEGKKYLRSSLSAKLKGKDLIIDIAAQDVVALRATTTGLLKLMAVYDKLK